MWVWYVSTVIQKGTGAVSPGPWEPWQNICDILSFFMVTKLVDRQNYPLLLPQEMPGIHSMLNQFDSKDLLVYSWISFLLLSKWLPILIIGPGKVNIWEPGQAGQAWISITTLGLPIWALYITEEEVWRTRQRYLREVSANVYSDFIWKYPPPLFSLLPF